MILATRICLSMTLIYASLMLSVAFAKQPNVLFIVCDDLNTHVSTSGYPHIQTPAFDRTGRSRDDVSSGLLPVSRLWTVTSLVLARSVSPIDRRP